MKNNKMIVYPWNLGLDRTNIPGVQSYASIESCKNLLMFNRGSKRKSYGVERIPSAMSEGYVQNMTQFNATTSSGQVTEVIRIVEGRFEVFRDDDFLILIEDFCSPTDVVTFTRYANALIIFTQNTKAYYYTVRAALPLELPTLESHITNPPRFGSSFQYRLVYAGRGTNPHVLTMSATGSLTDYSIYGGGVSMNIEVGDGDEVGIN